MRSLQRVWGGDEDEGGVKVEPLSDTFRFLLRAAAESSPSKSLLSGIFIVLLLS